MKKTQFAESARTFDAKWSTSLKICTWVVTGALVALAGYSAWALSLDGSRGTLWTSLVGAVATLMIAVVYGIRDYRIEEGSLRIRRMGWDARYDLEEMSAVFHEPEAMRSSIRLWGIGGLFSFSGYFLNGRLGRYQAYVTDGARTVVLRLRKKTIVVSPADPDAFVTEVSRFLNPRPSIDE